MAVGVNGPPVLNGSAYIYPEQTLAQLRQRLLIKLGYAAQLASPPPGMNILLNAFLQDANEQLYHRYAALRQKRWWSVAIEVGERFYDVPYLGAYLEGNTIALNSASPDTITTTSGSFVDAGFTNGMTINISGSASNDGYRVINTVAAGTLTLVGNLTFTSETAGGQVRIAQDTFINLDMQQITYAGLLDGTIWNDLYPGIDPLLFNVTQQSRPTHYQIREFIEVFPEPDKAYTLYLFGRPALMPFTADAHITSVDPLPVYLQALGEAKAHYGSGDAQVYFQRLEGLLGSLNSESFGTTRFIPNPQYSAASLPYPKVTFARP